MAEAKPDRLDAARWAVREMARMRDALVAIEGRRGLAAGDFKAAALEECAGALGGWLRPPAPGATGGGAADGAGTTPCVDTDRLDAVRATLGRGTAVAPGDVRWLFDSLCLVASRLDAVLEGRDRACRVIDDCLAAAKGTAAGRTGRDGG